MKTDVSTYPGSTNIGTCGLFSKSGVERFKDILRRRMLLTYIRTYHPDIAPCSEGSCEREELASLLQHQLREADQWIQESVHLLARSTRSRRLGAHSRSLEPAHDGAYIAGSVPIVS